MAAVRKRRRRKVKVTNLRVAGKGGDGHEWGVSSLITEDKKMIVRRKPCDTCPYRKDSQVGRFPPEAYRAAADVAEDMSQRTFACHEAGSENPMTCAGFILTNADNNLSVRLAYSTGRIKTGDVTNPDNVPLYESYKDMAIANGVDPNDPAIAKCRGNNDP